MNCIRCPLSKTRYNLVKGRGSIPADILLIGEAPGVSEDLLGQAFIGPSGELLELMLKRAGLAAFSKYFTNIILCRPCFVRSAENREPLGSEIAACSSNLMAIIEEVQPQQIILVGSVSQQYYKKKFPDAISIQHPSFLLRSGGISSPYFRDNVNRLKTVLDKFLQLKTDYHYNDDRD